MSGAEQSSHLRGLFDLFWSIAGAVSVQSKIMGIVLVMVLLFGLTVTLQVRALMTQTLTHKLQEHGRAIARDLASRSTDLILTHDLFALHELLRDMIENNEDVRYVFVLDRQGEVIAHTFGQRFPLSLIRANQPNSNEPVRLEILESEEGLIWDFAAPIFDGRAGTARLGISGRNLQETVGSVTAWLLFTTITVSLLGLVAGYGLTHVITRPISTMVDATRAVARGDLSVQAPVWARDEIGALGGAFNRMVADLARARAEVQRKEELRAQLLHQVITAQEEERKRIARELHDQTGQQLTSLLVGLTVIEGMNDIDTARAQVAALKAQVGGTLDDVRALARELRPSVLDDMGLVDALERQTRDYARRFRLVADFQTVGFNGQRLAPEIETALYRIVQEALTNVARHAEASSVSLLLEHRDTSVLAIIDDNGKGFPSDEFLQTAARERHLGLFGMQERAALLGGQFTIESEAGKGTTVFVEIPL